MNSADVLLRRPDIAGVLEGNPRVPGFEQHGDHLAPQVAGFNGLTGFDLSRCRLAFIFLVGVFEGFAV